MQDGWLKTGDVGHMDARGYVTITDRKKDVILVSGFKVFPNEVEGVLAMMPGVLESGAVGIPDARTGEAVKVVIVKKDPALTAEAVHRALQGAADGLQGAASRGVPRLAAEVADRQGAKARAARAAESLMRREEEPMPVPPARGPLDSGIVGIASPDVDSVRRNDHVPSAPEGKQEKGTTHAEGKEGDQAAEEARRRRRALHQTLSGRDATPAAGRGEPGV